MLICWRLHVDFLPHAPETLLFITAKRCETAIILQRCVDRAVCPTKMQSDVDVMFGVCGLTWMICRRRYVPIFLPVSWMNPWVLDVYGPMGEEKG